MKLLPTYLLDRFQATGDQLHESNPLVVAHFFIPNTNWHYYAFDYDADLRLFSGYITGIINDFDVFHILSLNGAYHPWGEVVIDEHWIPIPFRTIKSRLP